MKCNPEIINLMHQFLDGDINQQQEQQLRAHLQSCETCQQHFQELKRTVTLVTAPVELKPSNNFTSNVMAALPKVKKRTTVKRWIKLHPMLTAAAIFFIFMVTGIFSAWNQDDQLSYSKAEGLIVENGTVIVPKDVVLDDDLVVHNGNVQIDGQVNGNVVVMNGENLSASAGKVTGEIKEIDRLFERLWYKIKSTTRSVFHLE